MKKTAIIGLLEITKNLNTEYQKIKELLKKQLYNKEKNEQQINKLKAEIEGLLQQQEEQNNITALKDYSLCKEELKYILKI